MLTGITEGLAQRQTIETCKRCAPPQVDGEVDELAVLGDKLLELGLVQEL